MAMYIDENNYPQNYDWIPEDKKLAIIDFMNDLNNQCMQMFQLYRIRQHKMLEQQDYIDRRYFELCAKEDACIALLDSCGIKLRKDWVGHRGSYFFVTYDDAIDQNDYLCDLERDAEGDVDMCYAGDDYDY